MTDHLDHGYAHRSLSGECEAHFRRDPRNEDSSWKISSIDWSWPSMTPNGLYLFTARLNPADAGWADREFGTVEAAEKFVLEEIETRNLRPPRSAAI